MSGLGQSRYTINKRDGHAPSTVSTRWIAANEKDDGSLYPAGRARNRRVEIAVLS